jgi:hypothetical protein
MNDKKKGDKLYDIENEENLVIDSKNTKRFGDRAMDIVREQTRRNLEELRRKYINMNMDMNVYDMDIVNEFVEYLKEEA